MTEQKNSAIQAALEAEPKYKIKILEGEVSELTKRYKKMDSKLYELGTKIAVQEEKIKTLNSKVISFNLIAYCLAGAIFVIMGFALTVIYQSDNTRLQLEYQKEIYELHKKIIEIK
ncbi:MAG: hypothetical protein PQ612_06385 [Rickettsiales bacterium]|nr:hypothetical protein [Pseudomonadota bacterium]MDA0966599.1 hypothetical protein [Pseudomonadota bacterium]MDG4543628.1 hypothetical protein [Rickettsiales bacterium]MDG4545775.1 hypothetical protein [Rickettsiales bacterium]MDG4547452.1 hypothetical protein [Rickettsiales bacterium]